MHGETVKLIFLL